MPSRLIIAAAATLASLLASTGTALADIQTSSNWSGYAVHRTGVHFRRVGGEWRVPKVNCSSGSTTYSAMWVGIGGFSATSNALEQTGTEADCDGYEAEYSAWYELVPSPSRSLTLTVRPGDLMRAQVDVRGRRVTLVLANLTRHRAFTQTFTRSVTDTTSAEWILEAPGDCSGSRCVTLPLSDFHRAMFRLARVVTTSGRAGAITGAHWSTTRITLGAGGRRFVDGGAPTFTGGASPSGLSAAGSAFSLRYTSSSSRPVGLGAAAVASDRLVH